MDAAKAIHGVNIKSLFPTIINKVLRVPLKIKDVFKIIQNSFNHSGLENEVLGVNAGVGTIHERRCPNNSQILGSHSRFHLRFLHSVCMKLQIATTYKYKCFIKSRKVA